jgi:hypothetical protein
MGWGRQQRAWPSAVAETLRRLGQGSRTAAAATSINVWTATGAEQTPRREPSLSLALKGRSAWLTRTPEYSRVAGWSIGLWGGRRWLSLLGERDLYAEPCAGPRFRVDVQRALNGCDSFTNSDESEPAAG